MKKKNRILTEGEKKQIIQDKEKLIINSFAKTFNKIKRINENEIPQTRLMYEEEDDIDYAYIDDFKFVLTDTDGDFYVEFNYYQMYETIKVDDSDEIRLELGISIEGSLINFRTKEIPYEPQTLEYPGDEGGIEEIYWDGIKFWKMTLNQENQENKVIKGHDKIIATLAKLNHPSLPQPTLLKQIEKEIEDEDDVELRIQLQDLYDNDHPY